MDRCHVDITGLHPRTARGSQYILTCVDAFLEVSSESAPLSTIIAGDPASVVPQQQRPRRNVHLLIRYGNSIYLSKQSRLGRRKCRDTTRAPNNVN